MRALERYAPLTGVGFVALAVLTFIITGDEAPNTDEPIVKVVAYWRENDGQETAAALIGAYASVLLLWFGGVVRSALRALEGGSDRLAATAFGGIVVAVAASLVNASLQLTVAWAADDREMTPQAIQALSALYSNFFIPILAGLAVFFLATGLAMVRGGAPAWLGWSALVIGLVGLTPAGFIGLLVGLLWILVYSVRLFMAQAPAGPAAPPAANPPPARP
jgi:hypothetical protein